MTTVLGHRLFKGGNYSREETIQGRKLFKGGNYMRKYGMYKNTLPKKYQALKNCDFPCEVDDISIIQKKFEL